MTNDEANNICKTIEMMKEQGIILLEKDMQEICCIANQIHSQKLLFDFVKYLQNENVVDSSVSSYIDDFLSKQ